MHNNIIKMGVYHKMMNLIKMIKPKNNTVNHTIKKQNLELIEEIKEVCSEIAKTENWFQMESNIDLIEACIYQRECLNSKYKYLIKKFKLNNDKLNNK